MVAFAAMPASPAIDGPRPARPGDVPEVVALVDAAMRAGTDQTMRTDYPLVYADGNLRNVRILRVNGELVSVVPVLPRAAVLGGRPIRIGIISPTATAPAHRHRGYASRCLASAIEAMREARCALSVLWTLVETFPFYERAGYHPVPYQGAAYRLGSADAARFAGDPALAVASLDACAEATLEAIRALHDADAGGEGVRRDASETRALFALPKMRTLVARRGDEVVAYAVVSDAVNKPGLIEAGGDPPAIEALVRHVLAALPAGATIDAHALLHVPTMLGSVLAASVPERRRVVEDGLMVRINDLAAILGHPPPIERTGADWVAELFGSHPARSATRPASPRVPLSLPIPVLDRS